MKSSNVTATNSAKDDENIAALAAATEEMDKLRITMDQLEKERDFFFNRLQEVRREQTLFRSFDVSLALAVSLPFYDLSLAIFKRNQLK